MSGSLRVEYSGEDFLISPKSIIFGRRNILSLSSDIVDGES